jgi:hypothetical protein
MEGYCSTGQSPQRAVVPMEEEEEEEEDEEVEDKLIVEENYLPEQIFNMDETSLFWKRMPEKDLYP